MNISTVSPDQQVGPFGISLEISPRPWSQLIINPKNSRTTRIIRPNCSLCLTISILLSIRLGVLQQKENFLLHENGMSSVLRRIASISDREVMRLIWLNDYHQLHLPLYKRCLPLNCQVYNLWLSGSKTMKISNRLMDRLLIYRLLAIIYSQKNPMDWNTKLKKPSLEY